MKKTFFPHFFQYKLIIIYWLTVILNLNLYAELNPIDEYHQLFKAGQYQKAIAALENISPLNLKIGQKAYLTGMTYAKLQEYDKAIKHFEKAINEKNENQDLPYEYGQALYAANELKTARTAFKKSVEKKFNVSASLYYIAHISQLIEELMVAKDYYVILLKRNDTDIKIKQIAKFQLGETLLLIMREKVVDQEKQEKDVEKYILPMIVAAYEIDKSTTVAFDIKKRLEEIKKEFNLDPDILKNGRKISAKRYSGYLTQRIKFDDNVSLTNEENNVSQSKKETFIFETEAYTKYDLVYNKKFLHSPEIRISFVRNQDQDSPEVFQNDSMSLNANLKNKYEHTAFANPASFLFDLEFSKMTKDWRQTHIRSSYANSVTIGIGESFSYFKLGDTSFKLKRKNYTGKNEAISNHTYILSGDQSLAMPNNNILIALFEANFIQNFNNQSSSTNTYLLRFDYLINEIMPKYTLGLALATTLTDTKDQIDTRGFETSINPSLDLAKTINDKMKISINLDFTKNKSKQSDYHYRKLVFNTEFRFSF